MDAELDKHAAQTAIANRVLGYVGLATGVRASLGHVSIRLPNDPGKFMVKGRGYRMDIISRMRPEDMVTCDLQGRWLDGPPGSMPCGEVKIHSCIMRARPDVQAVVHVHPKYTVILSTLRQPVRPIVQEGALLVRKPLPVYPHTKIVSSEEEGSEVARLLGDGDAIMMLGHGAVTVGRTAEEAVMRMIHLEHQAEMTYHAVAAMGPNHPTIPDELLEEMANAPNAMRDYPHFRERYEQVAPLRNGRIWEYYTEIVSQGL